MLCRLTFIGLLDTIMPDGSRGFSLLLIITAGFRPIQLGFGFTLNGVGGLGGVNRTMSTDALHAGFMAHTLDHAPDPVESRRTIISDTPNIFPPAEGRYLFGPMLRIGWGTPTLISLALGVIIEVPDPVRLVILGLSMRVPTEDEALIELHIDVLGIVDFGTKTLSIDGPLYNSRPVYSLAGDLALRLSWGDDPNFVFSLGGFNPHFNTDGLNVPEIHRMSVSIGDGDNPRISANCYFAITSNTVQFGANVEAYAAAGGFAPWLPGVSTSDYFFAVLFRIRFLGGLRGPSMADPLGLHVDGTFAGPRPGTCTATPRSTFLFFSVSASVDLTWETAPRPSAKHACSARPYRGAARSGNWSAVLPDRVPGRHSRATETRRQDLLRVHPIGTLAVKEKVVPLDLPITRYGNATPPTAPTSRSSVQINT